MRSEERKESKVFEGQLNVGTIIHLTSITLLNLITPPQQTHKASIVILILHMKKLRLRGLLMRKSIFLRC